MSRRPIEARVHRVVLSLVAVVAALAIVEALWPISSGIAPTAWAETQTISDGATVRAPDRLRGGGIQDLGPELDHAERRGICHRDQAR